MLHKWLVLVGIGFASLVAGCNNDTMEDREEFAGVITTEDGRALGPVNVPQRKGDAILGPIAASAEPAAAEGAGADREGEEAAEIAVDDSSAQAVADSLVAIVKAGNFDRLPDVVPVEQSEPMREMVTAYGPIARAARQLKLALDAKFPGHDVAGFFPISQTLGSLVSADLAVTEIRPVNDEEAVAVLAVGPADGTTLPVELTVKKAEEAWRVVLPDFAPPPDIAGAAQLDEGKEVGLADIARRVESGDLVDVQAVQGELAKVTAGTYEPVQPGEPEAASEETADAGNTADAA